MKTGAIIARFQTPYLHEGHISLIEEVASQHTKVILVLGVSPLAGSRRNPYDYYTREKMIKSRFPGIVVLPLSDHPSDKTWSLQLDQLLKSTFPSENFILYGSRDSFIPYYSGTFEVMELAPHGTFNSTEVRDKYSARVLDSEDFRTGVLYALHSQYTKVYPTVDIAVFKDNKQMILLGQKATTTLWRLPGGFTDPEDHSYEMAAKRELTEEVGAIEVSELTYETSRKIDDWRYRSEADKIITILFSCDHIFGEAQAADDLVNLEWFSLDRIPDMIEADQIAGEHFELLECLVDKYKN